jgi:hypothetical protein
MKWVKMACLKLRTACLNSGVDIDCTNMAAQTTFEVSFTGLGLNMTVRLMRSHNVSLKMEN